MLYFMSIGAVRVDRDGTGGRKRFNKWPGPPVGAQFPDIPKKVEKRFDIILEINPRIRKSNRFPCMWLCSTLYTKKRILSMAVLHMLFGAAVVLYTLSIAIYNLYIHPLKDIPGPFFARITSWWLFVLEMRGYPHTEILELHRKYGMQ